MLSTRRFFPLYLLPMIAWSIAIVSCVDRASGAERGVPSEELGLRIVWGGNEPKSYFGEISHEESPLKISKELSLDRSGSIRKSEQPQRVVVLDPNTRFGGCDISITAKLDSTVTLKFHPETSEGVPVNEPTGYLEARFTLEQILSGPKELILGPKSRVVIDRAPGDLLRVSNLRPNWIFAPGESIPIQVTPAFTSAKSQSVFLDWELLTDGETDSMERGSVPIHLNEEGSSTAVSLGVINAPLRTGCYEVRLHLRPRRSFTQVFPASIADRRIQFVVTTSESSVNEVEIDPNRRREPSIAWSQSSIGKESLSSRTFPVSVRPWGRVANNLRKLSLNKSNDESRTMALGPRETLSLPIEGLQPLSSYAFSFATESTMDGIEVHISEILESGGEANLRPISVSMIQPSLGRLLSNSSDLHGQQYSYRFTSSSSRVLVRIISLRAHGFITLSQIRVQAEAVLQQDLISQRAILQNDAPKIIEYMQADQWRAILAKGRRLHSQNRYDTWPSIRQATEEWLTLCKARGANCVAIPVLSSGSALYPSERLLTNPLLNTGVFDPSASDPATKDIVDWLYSVCDSFGLQFIPVFEWNHSLHSFKNLPIKADMWGTLGGEPLVGVGRWNPYHSEVQVEMKALLKEFEKRYSKRKGYRGYAMLFGKTSPIALAESIDQISDPIVSKLLADQSGRIPNEMTERRVALGQLSGHAMHLKHQQLLMSIFKEWDCDLIYVFTDTPQSIVDLAQSGPSVVYVHATSQSLGPWIARRWWLEGFRPIAYQTNIMDAQVDMKGILPADSDWLTSSIPIEGQALQRRIDRIRAWRSNDSTRAAILNANPWDSTVNLQWSVIPQNLRVDKSECKLEEIQQSPSSRNLTIPANQIVVLSWENPNATPHTWGTDESQSLQSYQLALQTVESAINQFSIPTARGDLLLNADFDQTLESSKGELIPGWGSSINPKAPVSLQSETPHSAPHHLRVECDRAGAAAWLQSTPFALQSNRLQVEMHYRVQPGSAMNLQWTLFIWNETNSRFEVVSRRSASIDFSKRTDAWGKWTEDFSEELAGLGVSQCKTCRLQLDVQGDCTMDIDSLALATDYLLERERIDFRNTLFLSRRSLTEGSSEAAYRLLDSSLVRTLLLWMKESESTLQPIQKSSVDSQRRLTSSPETDASKPADDKPTEPEKRAADRRWRLWNR